MQTSYMPKRDQALAARHWYLIDAQGFNKVKGRPFAVQELVNEIRKQLGLSANGQPNRETTPAVAELAGAADNGG